MSNSELFKDLIQAIEKGKGVADILRQAKDNKFLNEVLSSKITIEYCMIPAKKITYTPLTYAIAQKNDAAVKLILQYAAVNELLKEALNEQFTINSSLNEEIHNALTFAVSEGNEEAYINILERAKDAKMLKEILTSKVTTKPTIGNVECFTPLTHAIDCKDDRAIKCILLYAKNDLLKIVLKDAANDLYKAVIHENKGKIVKFHHLLSEPGIAHQVFKTGMLKYIFTHKEANELAEQINKGKYEEAINAIQKRQALISGAASVAMIAIAVGLAAGAILGGIAMGLTVVTCCLASVSMFAVFMNGMHVISSMMRIPEEKSIIEVVGIVLGIVFIVIFSVAIIVAVLLEGVAVLPVAIAGAAMAMGLMVGITTICKAIYHGLNKIEVSDHELGTEKTPDHNESSESEVSDHESDIEEGPNDEVTQIKLEEGIVIEEEGIDNGGMAVQSIAV